jgi:hypothetical protein
MDSVIPLFMFASLMLVGLVAGILLATQLGQVRVQKQLGARDFTLVKHTFEIALGRVMPILVIAARGDRCRSSPRSWLYCCGPASSS